MLPTPKGENVIIITGAGGSGVLLSDACVDNGLSLMAMPPDLDTAFRKFIPPFGAAGNPVDITASRRRPTRTRSGSASKIRAFTACARLLAHDHYAADGVRQAGRRSRRRDEGQRNLCRSSLRSPETSRSRKPPSICSITACPRIRIRPKCRWRCWVRSTNGHEERARCRRRRRARRRAGRYVSVSQWLRAISAASAG